ncbi:MAG: hypothetical protein CL666_04275 [Balneola sp.]|nr:hypothetical protein [Balneola sp.]|tara:strand:- start:21861 stop:22631 length:771 start_codon:yes stop_codon:yes gene_type:complete
MTDLKTYNRKAISRILTKASEIQAAHDLDTEEEGLNEADLLHVAREVGISDEALKEALLNYDSISPPEIFNWLSGSSKVHNSSVITGKITDEKWDDIIHEIRRITGGIGKISKAGSSYEWEQRRKEIGYRHLSIKPEKDKTRIQYVYNWWGVKLFSMIVPFTFFAVCTAIGLDGTNFSDGTALLFTLAGGLAGLPLGRLYLRSYFNKQKRMVSSLFSSISKVVKESSAPAFTFEDESMYPGEDISQAPSPTKNRTQ